MALKIDQIKSHGQRIKKKEAKTYTVNFFDESGPNAGRIHLLQAGGWYDINLFSIAPDNTS